MAPSSDAPDGVRLAPAVTSRAENLRGAAVTIGCFGCWAVNDALMKVVMRDLPELQTIFVRNLFVLPLLVLIALRRGELVQPIPPSERFKVLGRVVGDVLTTFTVLAAINSGHLADVAVILGAQPLFIMLGAAACLGERIDRVAWAIGLFGMLGVVLVAQPGKFAPSAATAAAEHGKSSVGSSSGLSSVFALAAVGFGTMRDLTARRISSAVPATQIAALAASAILLTAGIVGVVFVGGWIAPTGSDAGLCATAAVLLAGALIGSVVAMRTGEVGFVQPFRYSYIVWAMVLGIALFGNYPDALTLAGAAIVAGCGIASLMRERRRHGRLAPPAGACRLEEVVEETPATTATKDAEHGLAASGSAARPSTDNTRTALATARGVDESGVAAGVTKCNDSS